ncbi:uncharacterized protein FOMMEDRAFT_157971 [Fomitiporia mediterranea MF3/22]|uniref:uncharacterized protein n=1 Tax=Fomitiporia mediterranea (strain MF3/22) TaxID=694068 RepID=UPI00044083D9|nr:uncharacterized protein FOMMEDRAFT_157971 [Fomitiporia mediterranea MF3/22]EJD00860.1 hypothetical protein FOMMEDRAFT_157971 [Fomitiporia mediterranea MF3/22]
MMKHRPLGEQLAYAVLLDTVENDALDVGDDVDAAPVASIPHPDPESHGSFLSK